MVWLPTQHAAPVEVAGGTDHLAHLPRLPRHPAPAHPARHPARQAHQARQARQARQAHHHPPHIHPRLQSRPYVQISGWQMGTPGTIQMVPTTDAQTTMRWRAGAYLKEGNSSMKA